MNSISMVPKSVVGSEEANELIANVRSGIVPVGTARDWIAELRREGLTKLAVEISARLPTSQ